MVDGGEITEGNLNEIETDRDYGKSRSEGSKAIECARDYKYEGNTRRSLKREKRARMNKEKLNGKLCDYYTIDKYEERETGRKGA